MHLHLVGATRGAPVGRHPNQVLPIGGQERDHPRGIVPAVVRTAIVVSSKFLAFRREKLNGRLEGVRPGRDAHHPTRRPLDAPGLDPGAVELQVTDRGPIDGQDTSAGLRRCHRRQARQRDRQQVPRDTRHPGGMPLHGRHEFPPCLERFGPAPLRCSVRIDGLPTESFVSLHPEGRVARRPRRFLAASRRIRSEARLYRREQGERRARRRGSRGCRGPKNLPTARDTGWHDEGCNLPACWPTHTPTTVQAEEMGGGARMNSARGWIVLGFAAGMCACARAMLARRGAWRRTGRR